MEGTPHNDDASHAANGFMTFACSGVDYRERLIERFADDDEPEQAPSFDGRDATTGY